MLARAYYAPMMSMLITMDRPGGRCHRKRNFYPWNIIQEKLQGWQWTSEKTFRQELGDFVRLCAGKQGTIAGGFAGLRAVEIANAIYRSTGEKLAISLTPPGPTSGRNPTLAST